MSTKYPMRIVRGSGGSFLAPPGHPSHAFHIEEGSPRNGSLFASLDYALDPANLHVPDALRKRVQELVDDATLVCSELWLRNVYGYFKNCYSPDGVNRSASDCIISKDETLPPERHLAYLLVRTYFPDHEPRLDLIANKGDYGSKPCAKCDTRLQYEAKVDAFAEPITAAVACPAGGNHEPKEDHA